MLNEALRLIRVFHDMNQSALAERLGISKSHLSEVESNKKTPSLALIDRYSEVFDIPKSSILFFSESLDGNRPIENARTMVSSKIIALLNFIAERSGRHDVEEA
jgi:transcriptional regulator with XRE-family HTH domain